MRNVLYETKGTRSSVRAYVPQICVDSLVIIHTYNGVHKNINETSEDYLDVTIFKGSGFSDHNILGTKEYLKETDTQEFMHE